MTTNPTQADAQEFGLHIKQGGWRLGLLVARNVEKGTGTSSGANQHRSVAVATDLGKVSGRTFAEAAGTSADRVLRYLTAWEKAADAGYVPHAASLTPGTELDLDAEKMPGVWESFFRSQPNSARNDRLREQAELDGAGPAVTIAIASNPKAVAAAIKADSNTREAAAAALSSWRADHDHQVSERPEPLSDLPAPPAREQSDSRWVIHALAEYQAALDRLRGLLRGARQRVDLTDDEREILTEKNNQVLALGHFLQTALSGDVSTDWDTALAKLGGEPL
jgi:hypothetical protein